MKKESCPECGLTFKGGKRAYRTFGHPVVTLEQHLADHARTDARAAELESAMREQNALPRVEKHQPTKALCAERCRQAEVQSAIRLPVIAPSGMTMCRPSPDAILLDELPLPLPSKVARHRAIYGNEGFEFMPEDGSVPKLRSKPSKRRAATRREVSRSA